MDAINPAHLERRQQWDVPTAGAQHPYTVASQARARQDRLTEQADRNRAALAALSAAQLKSGKDAVLAALDPDGTNATQRLQTSIVSGLKADFGVMLMDPDPLRVDAIHHRQ